VALEALWWRLRADLGARWRSSVALAVLVGVLGAVVVGAVAGARRTDTAYTRLLASSAAADVLVSPPGTGFGRPSYYDAVARLPQVERLGRATVPDLGITVHGHIDAGINAGDSVDGALGTTVERVTVLQGRMWNPHRADEVVVSPQFAALARVGPGDRVHMVGIPDDAQGNEDLGHAFPLTFLVTGIVLFDNQVVPVSSTDRLPQLLLTPAFFHSRAGATTPGADGAYVRLRPGTDIGAFDRALDRLAGRFPQTGGQPFIANLSDEHAQVQAAIHPEAVALELFALVAGVIGLAVMVQALGRQLVLDSADYPVLRALGMSRTDQALMAVAKTAAISAGGAVVAVVLAFLASPLMPIGPARLAEPAPGLSADVAVLGAGLAAVAVLPLLGVLPAAWRLARQASRWSTGDPGSVAGGMPSLAPLFPLRPPASAAVGLRMALHGGRGARAVPLRSALTGITLGIASLTAALIFGSSLTTLVSTPRLYGQDWSLELDLGFGAIPAGAADHLLSAIPGVRSWAGGNYATGLTIGGRLVPGIGVSALHGTVFPTLLEGRPPRGPHEIVLGARTLRASGASVGGVVTVRMNGTSRRVRVVGTAVFPAFGEGSFTPTSLGDGAALSASLVPTIPGACPQGGPCYNFFLVDLGRGANAGVVSRRLLGAAASAGCPVDQCQVVAAQRPADIANYTRVRATPTVLAGLLGLLAAATIAHVLLASTRRRRRDLAVLKVLGFSRGQVQAAVAWQATALALASVVVGVALGVAAGRGVWALFAHSVGVAPAATVPASALALTVTGALAVANLVAAVPGWWAGRAEPGPALRDQ